MEKKVLILLLSIVLLFPVFSFADGEKIIEDIVLSDTEEMTYEAEEEMVEGDITYKLSEIKYETLRKPMSYSEEFSAEGGEKLPEKKSFTVDGQTVELVLDKESIKKGEPEYQTYKIEDGSLSDLEEEMGFLIDGKDYVGKLDSYEDEVRRVPFTISGTYTGEVGSEYVNVGGALYPLNSSAPVFAGYEAYLIEAFGLNSSYTFTSARWLNEIEDGEQVSKTAEYSGMRDAHDFTGRYEIENFNGDTATYTNKGLDSSKYEIKVTSIYVPVIAEKRGVSLKEALGIGAGIAALAGAGAYLFFFLGKKKKKDEEKA